MEDRAMDRIAYTYGWTQRDAITKCGDCPLFQRSCDECTLEVGSRTGECALTGQLCYESSARPDWCPLEDL